MIENIQRKYEHTKKYHEKKNDEFEECARRNGMHFRAVQIYKNDAGFLELCKLLEGTETGIKNNLFAQRLDYLSNPKENDKRFKNAYASQTDGLNMRGSLKLLSYLDRGLNVCKLIDNAGQLTKKGQNLIKTFSSSEQ